MSGGYFNYDQFRIGQIASDIEQLIINNGNDELNEWGEYRYMQFSPEIIAEFLHGLRVLRQAEVYAQRIDWLLSGDDNEDSFHRRLQQDLDELKSRGL
jgi:hypothetical protein